MRRLMQIPLVRLFIINGSMGMAFGLAIALALFAVDFNGLGTLARSVEGGLIAVAMMSLVLAVTCASAAVSTAVMLLPEREEDDSGYGGMTPHPVPIRRRRGRRAAHGIPDIKARERDF